MSNPFDATASMLGYLYQVRLALVDSIRRSKYEGSFSVKLEKLDDVAFETEGAPTEISQIKHHITKKGDLTDASSDLWKTLRIWAGGIRTGKWPSDTLYYLITTASAKEGSIVSYLRSDDNRDPSKALDRLNQVAETSTSETNKSAYDAYLLLSPDQRLSLLNKMVVCDHHPDILAVEGEMRKELAQVVKKEQVPLLITRLEGWWFRQVFHHLKGEPSDAILSEELDAELHRLRQQFHDDNLPIDSDIIETEIDEEAFSDHLFVEQLRLIELTNKRILNAMCQYFRASEHRSKWLREGFLAYGELENYDRLLFEEWEIYFNAMAQNIGEEAAEEEMRKAARQLYWWAESEALFPIRSAVKEPFVTRGSLQILADSKRIGWHLKFFERLKSLAVEGL